MITNNELNAVKFSATKKDYYQIWNELIEVAGKISNRWDPSTTNESDPGVVLLKVLTAIADKINYNIDANTLEAFMPSAAQTESMRTLCEMMGYNVKYYQSATSEVTIKYVGDATTQFAEELTEITLPMFTTISNQEKDVNYVTLETKNFSPDNNSQTVKVMEGQHVQCETINNNVVTIDMLDDNNRFYLPETQIAENGIFIYRISDGTKSERWEKVDHLHTQHFNNLIYKFGYDSKEARPYVQFPEDIGQIIEDGLEIHYIRTSGIAGNTAAFTLSTFEAPSEDGWDAFTIESDFKVTQLSAAMNGSNIETITEAYKGFKKTVGTFDTLVTCRDYMNKIYNLMETDNIPMVSNIIVSDIRDDINRSVTLCGFNDFGICYTEKSIIEDGEKLIDHFDLIFYPFNTVYGYNSKAEYESSFVFTADNGYNIQQELEENKTIAHNIKYPNEDEIVLIKNYLKLDAKIVTTEKVSIQEETMILNNIYGEIYKSFNLRKLDFSEEIPFDNILDVIENADPRIKNVILNEPVLYTKFATADGREFDTASVILTDPGAQSTNVRYIGKELYNKLALRNVLAGRIELFNYNNNFKFLLNETKAWKNSSIEGESEVNYYLDTYPVPLISAKDDDMVQVTSIEPRFVLGSLENGKTDIPKNYILGQNQEIKFRAPNFKTDITYPAYVNYFLKLANTEVAKAIAAEFITFGSYLNSPSSTSGNTDIWDDLISYINSKKYKQSVQHDVEFINDTFGQVQKVNKEYAISYSKCINTYGALFTRKINSDKSYSFKRFTQTNSGDALDNSVDYYYLKMTAKSLIIFKEFLNVKNLSLYRFVSQSTSRPYGYLVDSYGIKYAPIDNRIYEDYLNQYYIPTNLGKDAVYSVLTKDCEYQLKRDEYLLINYTPSKSTTSEDGTPTSEEGDPIFICYGPGCIIKPNFDLGDSATLVNIGTKAYSKKNIDFTNCEKKGLPVEISNLNNVNMFGLGANEKIEHRNIASITLKNAINGNKGYNLYWAISDRAAANRDIAKTKRYVLKENEYFFIANSDKDAMSYYGNGTELFLDSSNVYTEFFGDENFTTTVSLDEILINGVSGIPWKFESFIDRSLVITEYQYITLGSSDTLDSIDVDRPITESWQEATNVSYTLSGTAKTLPAIVINKGLMSNKLSYENGTNEEKQAIANKASWESSDNICWEVHSALVLQTTKDNSIKLVDNESIVLKGLDKLGNSVNEDLGIKILGNSASPIVVKTNYPINGSLSSINTTKNSAGETVTDFAVRLSNEHPLGLTIVDENNRVDESVVKLHNFGENLTNIHFNKFIDTKNFVKFNLNIPVDCYGLLMIYYTKGSKLGDKSGAYVEANKDLLTIFNNVVIDQDDREKESWWVDQDAIDGNKKYLRPGINIIKIDNSINYIKLYPNSKLDHSVVVSDLSVVYINNDINLDLLDFQVIPTTNSWTKVNLYNLNLGAPIEGQVIEYDKYSKIGTYYPNGLRGKFVKRDRNDIIYYNYTSNLNRTEEEQEKSRIESAKRLLLSEINKLDPTHDFYYNFKIDNSLAIDLNTDLLDTEDAEILSTPRVWFDSNNINSKFVVSEIDASYLEDGIKIARSSKR